MNALDRIRKAHVAIMAHKKWCAYAALVACGKVEVRKDVKTAYTDGWNVTYGEEFVDSLTDRALRLVVLHENQHKAYRHLHIYQDISAKCRRTANIAMDHFVNLSLMDTDAHEGFIEMPPIGIKPEPKYRGWSVLQIFNDIYKPDDGGDDGEGGEPGEDGEGGEPGEGGNDGGMDEHDWERASKASEEDQRKLAEDIDRALRQGETLRKRMGQGAGSEYGLFGDLLNVKLDWRRILRQFLTATCQSSGESSWSRTNRRMLASGDTYMPGEVGKTARHLVVVFDTSGSCFGSAEMGAFVTQLTSIVRDVKPRETTVLYIDWELQGKQQFRNGQIAVQTIKPKGGGGTDMTQGFAWCAENRIKPDAMIILTDGFTPYGNPPGYPVLWAMTTKQTAPHGLTINITE